MLLIPKSIARARNAETNGSGQTECWRGGGVWKNQVRARGGGRFTERLLALADDHGTNGRSLSGYAQCMNRGATASARAGTLMPLMVRPGVLVSDGVRRRVVQGASCGVTRMTCVPVDHRDIAVVHRTRVHTRRVHRKHGEPEREQRGEDAVTCSTHFMPVIRSRSSWIISRTIRRIKSFHGPVAGPFIASLCGQTDSERIMPDDQNRTSKPNHAEGAHGEKTHAAFIDSLHEKKNPEIDESARVPRSGSPFGEVPSDGKHRLKEDRQQHDAAEKNSEATEAERSNQPTRRSVRVNWPTSNHFCPTAVATRTKRTGSTNATRYEPSPRRPAPEKTKATGSAADFIPDNPTIPRMRAAAQRCRGCALYLCGTQAVFGEGPQTARILVVGEQPGDAEDLAGKPFVGPAGKLLDKAFGEAGIARDELYLTNAVKHFKWAREAGGKRRIHKTPSAGEVKACFPWLELEIRSLKPEIVVCLGATAAKALLGKNFSVMRERGKLQTSEWAPTVIATVHPSAVLRAPRQDRDRAYRDFVADLKKVTAH